eukprot:3785110-Amphidinium_carterae.2
MAKNDNKLYSWWMVLTCPQFEQSSAHGTTPGYKDARGDKARRHQRMQNLPEYAINLAIHTRRKIGSNDTYNNETPMHLLCWRQTETMPHILTQSEHCKSFGKTHSNIYCRRGEDISIEYNPLYIAHGTDPIDIHIKTMLGSAAGTWELNNWSETDRKQWYTMAGPFNCYMEDNGYTMAHEHLLGDRNAQHKDINWQSHSDNGVKTMV